MKTVGARALTTLLLCLACSSPGPVRQHMGAYRFPDGDVISVRASVDDALRVRHFRTGASRRLYPRGDGRYVSGAGFSVESPVVLNVEFRPDSTLEWREADSAPRVATRINREEPIRFRSGGAALSGSLVLPDAEGPFAAVVLVHGSGEDAATDYFFMGDFLASQGIAALVYDKRGTGASTGEYVFDFDTLAADVVSAVSLLASRPDIDTTAIGLVGYSQGAWVAPLAASRCADVRYVVASYGLVESPAEEARVETRETLRSRGVGDADLLEVDELTVAAVNVVASGLSDGWDEFDDVKDRYRDEAWMSKLNGTVVGRMAKWPHWIARLFGRGQLPKGLNWYYDSHPVLEALDIPMVWFVAGADRSAPPELTLPALRALQNSGKPFDVRVFENADHTMLLFHEENGERVYTGYAPGYFVEEINAVKRLSGADSEDPSGGDE